MSNIIKWWRDLDMALKVGVVLILALVVNTVSHISHPAYRYYKSNIARLEMEHQRREKALVANIVTNFVPTLQASITNNTAQLVSWLKYCQDYADIVDIVSNRLDGVAALAASGLSAVSEQRQRSSAILPGHYWRVGSDSGVYIDGYVYRVGDIYQGEPIEYLNPSCMMTRSVTYVLRRPVVQPAVPSALDGGITNSNQ